MHLPPAKVILDGGVADPEGNIAVELELHIELEQVDHIDTARDHGAHGEGEHILHQVLS